MQMRAQRNFPAPGFTLVEMCVVAALIMILMAGLLPIISKIRMQAGFMQCAKNLKEIAAAQEVYATQYHQFCPMILDWNGSTYTNLDYDWHERLGPYIRYPRVFRCHSATTSGFDMHILDYGLSLGIYLYYVNGVLQTDHVPVTQEYILHPRFTILHADSDDTGLYDAAINHPTSPVGPASAPTSEVSDRHRGGSNVLFADLHVKWMMKDAIEAGTVGESGYLWDIGSGEP
jgi:prepilin-type processing-associated H-X9-DG protein